MKNLRVLLATICLTGVLAAPALGATCNDITMPDSEKSGGNELVLNGMGVRYAPFIGFPVYVAGLYLPNRTSEAAAIIREDQARRLVMQFVESVNASSMRAGMARSLSMNAGELTETLKEPIAQFQAAMTGFEKGQVVVFDYQPGRGTVVTVDGESVTKIEGADFAAAWISMWLGKPPNEELKTGLLGGGCN